jgi:death-on-curing protein
VKSTPDDCIHLTVVQVMEIHDAVIDAFGRSHGIRDRGLLESAIGAVQATTFGRSVFADLAEIAAAYLFYLCRNQPFVDGNKRVGMTSAIVYLRLNGVEPAPDSDDWELLVLDVANSTLDRDATTARLRKLLRARKARQPAKASL